MTCDKQQELLITITDAWLTVERQALILVELTNILMLILQEYSMVLSSLTMPMDRIGKKNSNVISFSSRKNSKSRPSRD